MSTITKLSSQKNPKSEFQKIFEKIIRFISVRPRSESEVKEYLKRRLTDKEETEFLPEKILQKLKELNLLNEQDFVKWWLEQRAAFRPLGKIGLKAELRRKGVDDELIRKFLENEVDEVELAKKAITKKMRIFRRYTSEVRYQKLASFLSRRGFSWQTIRKVLK